MTTQYLLPCSCGEKHVVDNRQAGETLACKCGNQLEVPTMRGLAQLERADVGQTPPTPKKAWGPRQGLFFLGTLLAAIAFGYAGYVYLFGPRLDLAKVHTDTMNLPPVQVWVWWQYLSNWVPGAPGIDHVYKEAEILQARRTMQAGLALGVVGLLVAASGLLVRPARR